jgi:hypothetical protein
MIIVTFINEFYVEIAYNFYLQLKKINREKNLIIFCDSRKTMQYFKDRKITCDLEIYKPLIARHDISLLRSKESKSGHNSIDYALINFIKHDIVYQVLRREARTPYVTYMDSDMIINADFVPDLISLMNSPKDGYSGSALIGIKYYLNYNKTPLKTYNQYIGRRMIVNCGFMIFHNNESTLRIIYDYIKFMESFNVYESAGNIDEILLTDYLDHHMINICVIPDSINMLSDCGYIYPLNEIRGLHTKTFHLTFYGDKKGPLLGLNQWLTLKQIPDLSVYDDCIPDEIPNDDAVYVTKGSVDNRR